MEKRYYHRELETMPRSDFLACQWQKLKEQIEYTYRKSDLCRRQFAQTGLTPVDIKTREDFTRKVPFTTKQDFIADQQISPPYGTRLAVAENEVFLTYLTSGTSGRGQEVHAMTEEDYHFYASEAIAMLYTWCGWKRGDKVMNPLPLGMPIGGTLRYAGLLRLGCDIFNLGMYDTKAKLELMQRFKISGINASAAYLQALTNQAEEMGLDPGRDLSVRRILMAGQAYPASFVPRMQEKWQAKIYDYYGATQYSVGSTCEKGAVTEGRRGYYHLFEHVALHEVIDPETGGPVEPGEVGELVVTPLFKRASPFLRFRMGDKVRYFPPEACDCGRPFPLLEAGTIARYDDMMKVRGMNIWPQAVDEVVLGKPEIAEYKGRVYISDEAKEKIEVAVEFKPDASPEARRALLARIGDELREKTGVSFITNEAAETLPRYVTKSLSLRWADERIKGLEKKRMD